MGFYRVRVTRDLTESADLVFEAKDDQGALDQALSRDNEARFAACFELNDGSEGHTYVADEDDDVEAIDEETYHALWVAQQQGALPRDELPSLQLYLAVNAPSNDPALAYGELCADEYLRLQHQRSLCQREGLIHLVQRDTLMGWDNEEALSLINQVRTVSADAVVFSVRQHDGWLVSTAPLPFSRLEHAMRSGQRQVFVEIDPQEALARVAPFEERAPSPGM